MDRNFLLLLTQDGQNSVITFEELERAFPGDPYIVGDAECLTRGFGFDITPTCHLARWN